MNKGVVILCMRKPSYACAAFNLALSIKFHSPDIHITLLSDGVHNKAFSASHFSVFDWIKEIKEPTVTAAKLSLDNYSPYKHSLYIDADSICLQPIEPIFDELKNCYFSSIVPDNYTSWTDETTFKDFFKSSPAQNINSSFIYWEEMGNDIFNVAKTFYECGFDKSKLTDKWGTSTHLPDELFFNGAIAYLGTTAKTEFPVMFFDDKKAKISPTEIAEQYYFMTFYGNNSNTRLSYREWYDREMFRICSIKGIAHRFKIGDIMAHKLVNEK